MPQFDLDGDGFISLEEYNKQTFDFVEDPELNQELSEEEIQSGAVYPDLNRIREISEKVAVDVSKYLFDAELATYRPEPHDHAAWVASKVFKEKY